MKMKMKNTQIMMMHEKLGFFKILKEALTIPSKNPNFIIFTLLTSIPPFCFLLAYETIFPHTLIETAKIISQVPVPYDCVICYDWEFLGFVQRLIQQQSINYFLQLLFYLGILHFLDLISLIAIVDSASTIYFKKKTLNLKELLQRLIKETRFKGPLITSIFALLSATIILFGLFSLATHIYLFVWFIVLYGILFIALLVKYIEWSAIWDMGIVISVLEEKQGDVALLVSLYLSKGNRRRGFLLALVFLVWKVGLSLSSLYLGWIVAENLNRMVIVAAGHAILVCLGNVVKWLAFLVYFYDCKKQRQEKNKLLLQDLEAQSKH